MMRGNKIAVPSYQRAYSWDTPVEKTAKNTQTDVFLADLEEYRNSDTRCPYYFGHFLFEERNQEEFYVIDGQQRLTTIVIFLAALFAELETRRVLRENEKFLYEDMVKRGNTIHFSTVKYDDLLFRDYVINGKKINHYGLDTESACRIVRAFDFFKQKLSGNPEEYLTDMLSIVSKSACTTHRVQDESEAIQMFIFQNNRGKRPSNLEIVKAQFMYNVHLYGNGGKDALIEEIKERFEIIYESISSIEYRITEDDVLLYTLRVYFNSLWEANALVRINEELKDLSENSLLDFIQDFTYSLAKSFQYLSSFFDKDEQNSFAIHSLITLGDIAIALPFIIKAYKYDLPRDDIEKLCSLLENLVLRHRLIGTKAYIRSRIDDEFKNFSEDKKDISPIIARIEYMKTAEEEWWAYWNNDKLRESLQGGIHSPVAKYLLWKYEVHLEQQEGNRGYSPTRFNKIEKPELEHIAPGTEPEQKPHGYDEYDEEFKNQYFDCLGNYLLLSKSHNCAIGNIPFAKKLETYTQNKQQSEIRKLVSGNGIWSKEVIEKRKEKIIRSIIDLYG